MIIHVNIICMTSVFYRFRYVSDEQRARIVKQLIKESTPDIDFFVLLIFSSMMATLGFLLGDLIILFGSALISPLMFPVLGFGLALSLSDYKVMMRSINVLVKGFLFVFLASIVTTVLFIALGGVKKGLLVTYTEPSILYFFVSLIIGAAVTTFIVREQNLSVSISNTMISIALIPPVVACGIALATFDFTSVINSFTLFLTDVLAIIAISTILFSIFNLHGQNNLARKTIEEEERRVEDEHNEVEKNQE